MNKNTLTPGLKSTAAFYLIALLFAGCATTTLTPTFPATGGLPQPDRVLVFDFAATPDEAGVERPVSPAPQTQDDVQVGRALAQALAANLVKELRGRGVNAYLASETAPPGETTVSIKGSFLRGDAGSGVARPAVGFTLGGPVRTRILFFQGTGLNSTLVSEGGAVTPSSLKPGLAPAAAIETDAKTTAQTVAERVVNYYRQQGWIK